MRPESVEGMLLQGRLQLARRLELERQKAAGEAERRELLVAEQWRRLRLALRQEWGRLLECDAGELLGGRMGAWRPREFTGAEVYIAYLRLDGLAPLAQRWVPDPLSWRSAPWNCTGDRWAVCLDEADPDTWSYWPTLPLALAAAEAAMVAGEEEFDAVFETRRND